jgi:predicted nucleic acid-binding protein
MSDESGRGRFFLDTNIFVYAFDSGSPAKRTKAHELIAQGLAKHRGAISYQVVQEFLNVATRRFAKPLLAAEAQLYLNRVLMPLCEIYPSASLYSHALSIAEDVRCSFYDALVISAALAAGCEVLWTEDLQHGRRIGGMEIRNPFRH